MSCAALLLMAGCTTGLEDFRQTSNADAPVINIDGSIGQIYTTRVDDGGFCDGDQVGLYGVNYTDDNTNAGTLLDEDNQVDNARYTFDESSWTWKSQAPVYYKDAETNIDLYAYYPYGNPKSVTEYAFEVQQDQSGKNANEGYAMSDFLWGKVENVKPSEAKVKIKFNHRMACVNVVLVEGEGFEEAEFDNLEKNVLVMNTTRSAHINLATGVVTATGKPANEGILMKQNAEGFRAIVVPQTVAAMSPLFSITIDGVEYRFKKDMDFVYEAGKQSKFSIQINKKTPTGEYEFVLTDTEMVDWIADLDSHGGEARQYYVVHCDEPETLKAKILADGKNPAKIKNLKVSGKITASDFYFMRDEMEILQSINLKESQIIGTKWMWYGPIDGESHTEYFCTEHPASYEEVLAQVQARYPESTIETHGWSVTSELPDNGIPREAFNQKSTLVNFVFPEKITKIGYYAFSNTTLSGALIIPDDVVEIGASAFYATNISSLQLPTNLKIIGVDAFNSCSSMAGSLTLPESLESIEPRAFDQCSMLSGTLSIPSKLTEIPDNCFTGCGFTGDLIIPDNIKSIGVYAFSGCDFNGQLILGSNISKINLGAFECAFQGELFIPKSVQVIDDHVFNGNNFSRIVFEEGSELVKIGGCAFVYNRRLSEPVVLPEGLITIGNQAFQACPSMPSIVIPSTVTTIGSGAFADCYYMSNMQCNATTPPVVGSGAFDGIGKENFTLEVPEQSVSLYQTANGWADFNRISAYYDFSISRKHMRTLNAEYSKTYMLRVPSGEAWKVESCPSWVSVSPSSGVGRTEVSITVSEMSRTTETFSFEYMNTYGNWSEETHEGRAGEIVFLLESKDRRVSMDVQQYDCDNYDGQVVAQNASVGAGVNIVFMGDCFDARDIATGSYMEGINEAIGYYFAIEPYKSYRDYFNIYTIVGMSDDSGMGTVNTVKDAKFGSQYSLSGIAPNTQATYEYAMKAATVNENNLNKTLVVMVENTQDYGGICYMWADGSAIAVCPMSRDAYPFDFRGIVQHEAGGHGFAKLADEYIYHNDFIENCSCICCSHLNDFLAGKALGWYRNLSTDGNYNSVEWAHLFAHPDYTNIVDMYEGGYYHSRGIYRSEANSCMNNNVPYYSAISRQEMVERIMEYAGLEFSIEDFYAKDVRDASNNDFVTRALDKEETSVYNASLGKQKAPKFMGEKPQINKSNQ